MLRRRQQAKRELSELPHVVVLGAGFAGVGALQQLQKAPVRVTLVDRQDCHTFQPLLYQLATNQLEQEHITTPLESLLAGREGFASCQGEVTGVDLDARRVILKGLDSLSYDYLLIALGALVNFYGTRGAEEHALPLYTLRDAERLRARIVSCLRTAAGEGDAVEDGVLRFCVIGGGATGVEVAGAMAELLPKELERSPTAPLDARPEVHVFEMAPELLTSFDPKLRRYAKHALQRRGVRVHLGDAVEEVGPDRIHLRSGVSLATRTVVWAAGLKGHPLAKLLGATLESGRPATEPDLSLTGHPEVFLAGDMFMVRDSKTGDGLPQLGSVAQQSGQRAGKNIARLVAGKSTEAFEYKDKGTMAIIGTGDAIVQLRSGRTLTRRPAWLAWKGVHLMLLAGGEQKARTLLEWGKGYTGIGSGELLEEPDTNS